MQHASFSAGRANRPPRRDHPHPRPLERRDMRLRKRTSALALGTALAIAAGLLLTVALPALASHGGTPPPWEVAPGGPDPNKLGDVVFYDALGNTLTGGTNLGHLAD